MQSTTRMRFLQTTGIETFMVNPDSPYRRPPLALIVTGQEWVSLSMVTIFSPKGYAVLRAFNGAQALDRAREAPPDLLIVDQELRDMSGTEFCRTLRQEGVVSAATPVLLISSAPWQRDSKLEALREGAWETCSLPMDSEEVFLKVDVWVRAKLAGDDTREQGLLDPDTGLYNTTGLLRRISELAAGAVRHSRPLACVVLSAEPGTAADSAAPGVIRAIQTAQGNPRGSGDTWTAASARSFAATLLSAGRASDAIGRLSATEFVIVAPDTDDDGVLGLAERLRKAVDEVKAEPELRWNVRFGCYAVPDMRDASIAPTEVLIRAAEALRGTEGPQERVRFFSPSPETMN